MGAKETGYSLKAAEKELDFFSEATGETGTAKNALDVIAEVLSALGDALIAIGETSFWKLLGNILETVEDVLRILAKAAGKASPLGIVLTLLSKLFTSGSHLSKAKAEHQPAGG